MKYVIIIALIILCLLFVVVFSCAVVGGMADDRLVEMGYYRYSNNKKFDFKEFDKKKLNIRKELEDGKQDCDV